jgi:hypothetical protein
MQRYATAVKILWYLCLCSHLISLPSLTERQPQRQRDMWKVRLVQVVSLISLPSPANRSTSTARGPLTSYLVHGVLDFAAVHHSLRKKGGGQCPAGLQSSEEVADGRPVGYSLPRQGGRGYRTSWNEREVNGRNIEEKIGLSLYIPALLYPYFCYSSPLLSSPLLTPLNTKSH